MLSPVAAAVRFVGPAGSSHSQESRGGAASVQGLSGSGDIHVLADSNLYLRRTRERLALSSEHLAAPAWATVSLELIATNAETTHLEVIAELEDGSTKLAVDGKRGSLEEHVLDHLPQGVAVTRAKLRDSQGARTSAWARRQSRLSEPAVLAARPLGGDARTDRTVRGGSFPFPIWS
jgi:hypothetical protein